MRALTLLSLLIACATESPEGHVFEVQPGEGGQWDDPTQAQMASPFTTIQAAIDAAAYGDTVSVPSGSYAEDITLKDGVSVVGAGQAETLLYGTVDAGLTGSTSMSRMSILDPTYMSSGVAYTNHGVTADGVSLSLDDVGIYYFNYGLHAENAGTVTANDLTLAYNWYGAVSEGTASFTLTNSLIASNASGGVAVIGGGDARITHNTVLGNAYAGTSAYLVGGIALANTPSSYTVAVANNIVTSNYYGIDCYTCDATWANNLVWGNTTNFVNDASASSTDVSGDPGFTNPSEGDFSLTASSICIDAGSSAWGASTDADGELRPQGAGYDIGRDEYASSAYALVITEVMANAASESTGELVEIYNAGGSSVDLAGFILTDGDETDTLQSFGGGSTTLAAGAYAVVLDPDYTTGYTIPSGVITLKTQDTELGNGLTTSDRVVLFESDGSTVASSFSYPRDPGDGISSELYDLGGGDSSGNWRASQCASGSSPGSGHCFPEAGDPSDLIISEVLANAADESTGEYVEIYNTGTEEIDAAGLWLADSNSSDTLEGYGGGSTLIGPGEHALIVDSGYAYNYYLPTDIVLLTVDDASIGNGLSTTDKMTLYDTDGTTIIDSASFPADPGDGYSMEKVDYAVGDVGANWAKATVSCSRGASPGRLNSAAGGACAALLITEVMSNPLNEDTGEFIEIYNAGGDTIDLAGLVISDGSVNDVITAWSGGTTTLAPGEWALVIDSEYASEYTLDPATVLVATADSTLGNGLAVGDEVYLYEADGDHLIDAFVWPLNPGNGLSVEREANYGLIDSASNWLASTCASGSSPGATNCVASGGSSASESSYALVITEVMSNPLDEGTGEFVEIYNAGTTDVDMLYMAVWDGDAVDTVFGFTDLYDTVLAAGEYAIILDSNYAGEYTIPSGTLVLVTDDATVGSGLSTDDPVYLYEAGGSALIDSYTFPTNPGNGTSVEKVDIAAGDSSTNWAASTCDSTPGSGSCP